LSFGYRLQQWLCILNLRRQAIRAPAPSFGFDADAILVIAADTTPMPPPSYLSSKNNFLHAIPPALIDGLAFMFELRLAGDKT